jgi:hypothetical protein
MQEMRATTWAMGMVLVICCAARGQGTTAPVTQPVAGSKPATTRAVTTATALPSPQPPPAVPGEAAKVAAVPTTQEVLTSKLDLWGETALHQPGGPSYEFFEKLLPPVRYVDARFRHYPINLSAPGAVVKGRLLSNGSQINALANQPNWRSETGVPVFMMVGRELEPFGSDLSRLDGPKFDQGYLPIVVLKYKHHDQVYQQEVFASVDPKLSESGVMFVRFTMLEGTNGKVEAQMDGGHEYFWSSNDEEEQAAGLPDVKEKGVVRGPVPTNPASTTPGKEFSENGPKAPVRMCFDEKWVWNKYRTILMAFLNKGESATIAIFTKEASASPFPKQLDAATYFSQRELCAKTWNDLLARGTNVVTPEAVVNNAWRATLIANYMLMSGDNMRYSAGNQYARIYIGEGGDATRALALWGQADDAKRMMAPLFVFTRKGLEFHQAAFKLQMMCHVYALTKDKQWVLDHRALWEKELAVILSGREKDSGMLPREKYCGDIEMKVYSLNSNSNCWRALREMSIVLAELGEKDRAAQVAATADEYRKVILAAIEKSKKRETTPPMLPVALSGEEEVHDPIDATRIGGYWNLMISYITGSGVFPYNSTTATEVLQYLQTKGGLCMGMTRVAPGKSFWVGTSKINDLYGMRYALLLLQRDEADRALVSFYGKLAQGMTRDTFIDGEASSIGPVDKWGRQFYLPPNSAANANYLEQLRYLLVQDYDLDDHGRPETLRLCFATPRPWLADARTISVTRAPTAFGLVSFTVKSELSKGQVSADVELPAAHREKTLLKLRLPDGFKTTSATVAEKPLKVEGEVIDLTGLEGHVLLMAKVGK